MIPGPSPSYHRNNIPTTGSNGNWPVWSLRLRDEGATNFESQSTWICSSGCQTVLHRWWAAASCPDAWRSWLRRQFSGRVNAWFTYRNQKALEYYWDGPSGAGQGCGEASQRSDESLNIAEGILDRRLPRTFVHVPFVTLPMHRIPDHEESSHSITCAIRIRKRLQLLTPGL